MKRRFLQLFLAWVVIIGSWEAAYRIIQWRPYVFPAPSHVLDATLDMLNVRTHFGEPVARGWPLHVSGEPENTPMMRPGFGKLPKAVAISALRLLAGFALSLVLGTGLGLLMWRWEFLDRLLGPLFLGFQTLPSVCWVPLAILLVGLNEWVILLVLVLGSCFATAISLRDGLRTIPPIFQRAGLMLDARGWRLYRYVLIPASMPAMASSLRQGFSFAWRSLMGAELYFVMVQNRGLGFLLNEGREFADISQVVALMVIMIALAMVVDRWVFAQLEHRVRIRFGLIGSG
jgi:NitT/TauT family transport system permease protein